MCNSRDVLITACVKSAINNANSPLGHNIAYFRNNYDINFCHDICFSKIIQSQQFCEKKRIIIVSVDTHVDTHVNYVFL